MTKPPIALSLTDVTKVYPGVVALKRVNLSLTGGEIVGLIGENGAGKSTLMKVLGGNIAPNGGTITVDGHDHAALTPRGANDLGMIQQAGLGVAYHAKPAVAAAAAARIDYGDLTALLYVQGYRRDEFVNA